MIPASSLRTTTEQLVLGRIKASYPRLLRILVPLDFSGKSRQALGYAVPVAQKFGARIHLVHVLPRAGRKTEPAAQDARHAAFQRLGRMSGQFLTPRVRAENAVLTGNPAEQIVALAEQSGIDLIVLTAKGQTNLRRRLIGSTAEYIMRHAPCPVLSVRRR